MRCPIVALLALTLAAPVRADEVVVFAAASLKTALDSVAADFEALTGHEVTISYGGSNALAQQVLQGAPADIYLSAAPTWMDAVEQGGLVVPGTRVDLWGNNLVLVAHGRGLATQTIGPETDLAGLVGQGKLAMAMVDAVPAGQYGRQALERLGLWTEVRDSVVQTENVRAALALVAAGEAAFGIVYATDVGPDDTLTIIGQFPADSHDPITYPAALLTGAADQADRDFLQALSAAAADATFAAQGFVVLP